MKIYEKVATDIETKIVEGEYKAHEKLPSERIAAKVYGVSRMTVRHAMEVLEGKGLIYREGGSGSYVKHQSLSQKNVSSFTKTVESQGYKVSTKILEFDTIHSLEKIAIQMELPITTEFYKVKRLRFGDGIPFALETIYIPKRLVPNLQEEDLEHSLYKILENKHNIKAERVSCQMEAKIANALQVKVLQLAKPIALLKVSGITYDEADSGIYYEESYYRSDYIIIMWIFKGDKIVKVDKW